MFIPLKKLLEKNIKKAGLTRQVEAVLVLEKFEKVLGEVFSQEISERVKPISLKNKVLTVAVLSSVMASELKLREGEILERLNKEFRGTVVERLRFMV